MREKLGNLFGNSGNQAEGLHDDSSEYSDTIIDERQDTEQQYDDMTSEQDQDQDKKVGSRAWEDSSEEMDQSTYSTPSAESDGSEITDRDDFISNEDRGIERSKES